MILSRTQIVVASQRGNHELRYSYDDPNLPDLGPGETVPAETETGRTLFWIEIGCRGKCHGRCENLGSYADDKTREIVYEYRRVPAPDTPRLLTPAGRPRGSELGYTDKSYLSLRDEPEAVDLETQKAITTAARDRDRLRSITKTAAARKDRQLLTIEQRMTQARQAASMNYVAIRDEIKAIRRMQRMGRADTAVLVELERVERLAYRDAA